jgi:cation diffusion facilitator CzcD-associated flavoprotein CzcO/amino acid transporter
MSALGRSAAVPPAPAPQAPPAQGRRLSTTWVVFLVVSGASPITSLVGGIGIGLGKGNGAGLPVAFAIVTVILLCFAVGYAQITRRVINTGAYYTYIAQGIGRPIAIGAALLAVVAYTINIAGLAAATGFFLRVITAEAGVHLHWLWGTVAVLALVGAVGYRSVRASARLMGTILVLGSVALLVYDIMIIAERGLAAFPSQSFGWGAFTSGSVPIALMFASTCFVGVDTAALYSEETREPERTVPRATYIAIAAMGVFYVLSIWLIIGSIGPDHVVGAASDDPSRLIFDNVLAVGGEGLQTVIALLFLAAMFAGILAFHNAASRYLYVLGRDRVVSPKLGRLHTRHQSPSRASLAVSVAAAVLVALATALRFDPFFVLGQAGLSLATLGIGVLQALAALAIVVFFRRRGQGRYWKTFVLPTVGLIGLAVIAAFQLIVFDDLLGMRNLAVTLAPWSILVVLLVGTVVGLVLRKRAPGRYARMAQSRLRPQARTLPRPARWTRRYALIGAGPAGLAMARRLVEEGVPFDWFEAGTDVGGIWHTERPGSPIYETLTTMTSKHVSAFDDFPMPANYPDYPQWWQVRDYLRAFAEHHQLYPRIQFRTAVTWAKPEGVGWTVTLTNGEFRYYSGVIAAPGTAWFPALPSWPGQHHFRGQLWHASRYKRPEELAGRRVLVVGSGTSAADIAVDAARAGATVFLSIRHGRRIRPRYVEGVPTDALLAGVLTPAGDAFADAEPRELLAATVGDLTRLGLPRPDPAVHAGHPVVTDDLLEYLSRGLIHIRGEVAELEPEAARFVDGTAETVDLIIAATGYEPQIPFLEPQTYLRDGKPDLFLNIFSRTNDGLAIVGMIDAAGPTFPLFDDQARAVIVALSLRELGGVDQRAWRSTVLTHPDLRGGQRFADTPARVFTVEDNAYSTRLRDLCDRFGYTPGGTWGGTPDPQAPPAPRTPTKPGLGAALRETLDAASH